MISKTHSIKINLFWSFECSILKWCLSFKWIALNQAADSYITQCLKDTYMYMAYYSGWTNTALAMHGFGNQYMFLINLEREKKIWIINDCNLHSSFLNKENANHRMMYIESGPGSLSLPVYQVNVTSPPPGAGCWPNDSPNILSAFISCSNCAVSRGLRP